MVKQALQSLRFGVQGGEGLQGQLTLDTCPKTQTYKFGVTTSLVVHTAVSTYRMPLCLIKTKKPGKAIDRTRERDRACRAWVAREDGCRRERVSAARADQPALCSIGLPCTQGRSQQLTYGGHCYASTGSCRLSCEKHTGFPSSVQIAWRQP